MSMKLALLAKKHKVTKRDRVLALRPMLKYDDGRTQQTFKNETDINRIMARAQTTGTISHLNQHQAKYADFSDFDFFESQRMLTEGRQVFDQAPSEIRKEFGNSPAKFFAYVNDPANSGRLAELLPTLAKPGTQLIDVSGRTPPPGPKAAPKGSEPPGEPPADPPPAEPPAE